MRLAASFWILVAACSSASPSSAPVAAAVDPVKDFVEIPDELCPDLGGWYAMTPNALRYLILQQREERAEHEAAMAAEQTARKIADARAEAATNAAKKSGWMAEHGWKIGLGIGVVSTVAIEAAAYLLFMAFGGRFR